MNATLDRLWDSIRKELSILWAAHQQQGLNGFMCLYTAPTQDDWRSKAEGIKFWFGPQQIDEAISFIQQHYNEGELPNSPMLLNPVVHEADAAEHYTPLGSGIFWATGFALGVAHMTPDQSQRLSDIGVMNSFFERGDIKHAGLKMLAISSQKLAPHTDNHHVDMQTVDGCRALYDLSNVKSDPYSHAYLLSGIRYLCTHGLFQHPHIDDLLPENLRHLSASELIGHLTINVQKAMDCALCFNAYDREHRLYVHFGQDPANITHNNRFYDLCARDLHLFDRTGPARKGSEETFNFVVPGLIPRGAVTLLAAAGGTGKSSVAHQLCVFASMEWRENEQPLWLGQPVNKDACTGICVYFSGEDGPAIVNARNQLFDPEGRALRLQFHRTEFEDRDMTFSQYLRDLRKMPDVSICVIDPARKFLAGNEDSSEAVSEFFEAIEEFAIQKQCAMIVVHHLQKGANPTSARGVLEELRGSQVFIDRPRVVIGMFRDEKYTVVGLAKTNIPPSLGMILDERVYVRNPKNLQLIWLPGEQGVRRDTLTPEELERIELEAFQRDVESMRAAAENQQ
ncbi:MAG: AAA family ATPase [Rickettsiales bacterium]|nr:AAA family ATPase [Rickettsiales bacterium]